MSDLPVTDVAIIGAGPSGLFAAFQCGMLGLGCHLVDALEVPGGQCRALYPEKPIFDIPGHPEILAEDLIRNLEAQARPFRPVYHLAQQVVGLEPSGTRWRLETSAGVRIEAGAVIVAAGGGAFGPNRPPLDDLADYEKRGSVRYLVARREELRGKRVVIGGGGDSAVDWAVALAGLAAEVKVVHRRAKFRAAPASIARLEALVASGTVELVVPFQLHALEGEDGLLRAVVTRDLEGRDRRLQADVLLPFYGLAQDLGPIASFGLRLEQNLIAVDPATCNAGRPGVFAIGDIASYPGKLKLILTAFAEAALAAHSARAHLHPDEIPHFEHSTTRGVPGRE